MGRIGLIPNNNMTESFMKFKSGKKEELKKSNPTILEREMIIEFGDQYHCNGLDHNEIHLIVGCKGDRHYNDLEYINVTPNEFRNYRNKVEQQFLNRDANYRKTINLLKFEFACIVLGLVAILSISLMSLKNNVRDLQEQVSYYEEQQILSQLKDTVLRERVKNVEDEISKMIYD